MNPSRKRRFVRAATKRALWQLALNGNPHWVYYFTTRGKPAGTNDGKCSTGHVDKKRGRDRTKYAGLPYQFTPERVDREKRCFGCWSGSNQGDRSTYRVLSHDVEVLQPAQPGKKREKVDNPTADQARKAYAHAVTLYQTWVRMAKRSKNIVAVGLF